MLIPLSYHAGFIQWIPSAHLGNKAPNEHKRQKGYMPELVTLKVDPEAWP